jgi:hypothetical protein
VIAAAWWNWKAALTSAICRGAIFLAANLPAGAIAGTYALATEFVFRTVASGALGSLTEACARRRLSPFANGAAVAGIAAAGHAAEYLVHRAAGTPRLGTSMVASVAFTLLTTGFNLYAMRRGVLITGAGRQTLVADLRRIPGLLRDFIRALWASRRCI